jgi:hypothetical protein
MRSVRASDSNLGAYTYFFFPYHLVHVSLYLGTLSRVPRDLIIVPQVGFLHHKAPTASELDGKWGRGVARAHFIQPSFPFLHFFTGSGNMFLFPK